MDNQTGTTDFKSTVYHGSLTHQQIIWLTESLDAIYESAPCHANALIRQHVKDALEKFIEPESIEEPTINNKFIKTIKIQDYFY